LVSTQAQLNPTPLVVPPTPLVLPTVEELSVAALEGLGAAGVAVATPIALTLGLILGTATLAQAPGIPQTHLLPINPKQLRFEVVGLKRTPS
jgi:Na+-driven multidrug efflux pump